MKEKNSLNTSSEKPAKMMKLAINLFIVTRFIVILVMSKQSVSVLWATHTQEQLYNVKSQVLVEL